MMMIFVVDILRGKMNFLFKIWLNVKIVDVIYILRGDENFCDL